MDLNNAHAVELREVISRYTAVARKSAGRPKPARRASASAGGGNDPKAVRAWAIENGIPVNGRGRIQADVMELYTAAH
ncbi:MULTISPECIES: histone-like nucleoid-structuring protein Lsr2 [unclassified Arthrobacter]|uniref:Lsr2 family DNA-binding protein n=1 Tax=unclassified Arthrobacter TaxID=235627 RepID=UPI0027DD7CC4|nr:MULTISPECIES: histone-like nucleoid-structuring protein Lsr2 [unclassified Arthrobacter]